MSDIDARIRAALGEPVDTSDLRTMVADVFRGRMRWLNILTIVWSFVFFGLAVLCTVRFFQADEVALQLRWMLGALFCFQAVGLLKLWAWMQMDKVAILREVKRLEVRLVEAGSSADFASSSP